MPQAESARSDARSESSRWLSGRKLAMLLCCAGVPFMTMLDTNIVAVSLPAIARDLHGEFTDVEWGISAYLLPFAGLLMPAGALADRIGRRRVLYLGLALFAMASLLCGLAPNPLVLNLARALQAVGGGALQLTASLAVIAHGFAPQLRYLGHRDGRRAGFGGNLGRPYHYPSRLALGLLYQRTYRFRLDGGGFWLGKRVARSTGGVALLVAFVFAERRHPRPMIDLTLAVIGAATAMLGYAAAGQLVMTILPVYLQDAFGQSAAQAGVAMIPFALPLLVGPSLGAALAALLTFGLAMVAVGAAVLAVAVCAGAGYWAMMVGMAIVGLATGVLNSETTKAQVSAIPPDRAGMASGVAGTTRFIGVTVGLTGIGAILTAAAEGWVAGCKGRGDGRGLRVTGRARGRRPKPRPVSSHAARPPALPLNRVSTAAPILRHVSMERHHGCNIT